MKERRMIHMKYQNSLCRITGAFWLALLMLCTLVACGDSSKNPAPGTVDSIATVESAAETEATTRPETAPESESEIDSESLSEHDTDTETLPETLTETDIETVSETETETETEPIDPIIASGEGSAFVIVCSAECSESVRAQAERLAVELGQQYGQAPAVVTDGASASAYEIRVGRTNRTESVLPADRPYAMALSVDEARTSVTLEAAREDFLERVVDRLLSTTAATEGVLRLSDVTAFADDGAAFTDGIAVAVNGATDYAVVLPTITDASADDAAREVGLTLEWIAHRLQQLKVDLTVVSQIPASGHYITVVVDEALEADWMLTPDASGNLTVTGKTAHLAALGLVELAGNLAPNAYGDILIPLTGPAEGDSTPYIHQTWSLAVPACRAGELAPSDYEIGSGRESDNEANTWSNGRMAIVNKVSEADYHAYGKLLTENGYVLAEENTMKAMDGTSYFGQYTRGLSLVFVSYTAGTNVMRIIEDRASVSEEAFEYRFEYTADTPTDVVLYGLLMHPQGIDASEPGGDPKIQNHGALLMIVQADGSLFVIDGGSKLQATEAAVDGLWAYMHEITGTPEGETIRIACWFMTHPHGDHYAMIDSLIKKYHAEIELERLLFNFQHARSTGHKVAEDMRRNARTYYPDALYIKCHTGQSLTLGSLTVDVMATHEDAVNPQSGKTVIRDTNSVSTVLRITLADGSRVMILGDVTEERDNPIATAYAKEELSCEMVQIAHHAWNALPRLYRGIAAEYTLWPQYEPSNFTGAHYDWAQKVTKLVKGGGAKYFYYAGLNTVRLTWKNGEPTVELTDVIY